jgi:hypothetical protein
LAVIIKRNTPFQISLKGERIKSKCTPSPLGEGGMGVKNKSEKTLIIKGYKIYIHEKGNS